MFNHCWLCCLKEQHFDLKLQSETHTAHSLTNIEQSVFSNIPHPLRTLTVSSFKNLHWKKIFSYKSHWCHALGPLRSLISLYPSSYFIFIFLPKACALTPPAPASPHSPSLGLRNHNAIQDAAGPSHVAINAISANMDSFARGRTAILKKQPSHMEAAHFGDLGTEPVFMCLSIGLRDNIYLRFWN